MQMDWMLDVVCGSHIVSRRVAAGRYNGMFAGARSMV